MTSNPEDMVIRVTSAEEVGTYALQAARGSGQDKFRNVKVQSWGKSSGRDLLDIKRLRESEGLESVRGRGLRC